MKYLVHVDGKLYGYNDPRLLLIDIIQNDGPNMHRLMYKKEEGLMIVSYKEIDREELKDDSDAYEEADKKRLAGELFLIVSRY